jgi:hypothetical protein
MQFSKNTSNSRSGLMGISIKVVLFLAIIIGGVIMLGQIDFPSPNKEIKKIIPNENLKIVK